MNPNPGHAEQGGDYGEGDEGGEEKRLPRNEADSGRPQAESSGGNERCYRCRHCRVRKQC
jgi:hypothetical protein